MFKPLGKQVHDLTIAFEIDEILLSLLHKKGKSGVRAGLNLNNEKMLLFGRQMLAVAITQGKMGLDQKNLRGNPWLDHAIKGRELEKTLDEFLFAFGSTKKHVLWHTYALRTTSIILKRSSLKKNPPFEKINREVNNLFKAKGTLRWLTHELENNSRYIKKRQNPGSPEKTEFAIVVMEAWSYLTGKVASPSNKRFSELLSAAWIDATTTAEVEDWEHHIRKASSVVKFQRDELRNLVPPWIIVKMGMNRPQDS